MRRAFRRVPLRLRLLATVALVSGFLVLTLYETGALNGLERQTVDARFDVRGSKSPGNGIVLVALDEKSLRAFNERPPIRRSHYVVLLDRLRAATPGLIAVDVQFRGRTASREDQALAAAIARASPVLLAAEDTPGGPAEVAVGRSQVKGAIPGAGAIDTDPDGVLRRMLYAPIALKTFAVRAAELIRHKPVSESDFPDNHAWIDFRGPPGTFPTYSLVDVLNGRVPLSAFHAKTVLVGVTDPGEKDIYVTAASSKPMSGVEIHANALTTILDRFPLRPLGGALTIVLLLACAALPALLALRLSGLYVLLATVGVSLLLVAGDQLAFNSGHIVPVLYPLLGLGVTAIGSVGADALLARRQLRALQAALGRWLPSGASAFFISYRREGATFYAHTLERALAGRFGPSSAFMDTSSLGAGQIWPREIDSAIRKCSVMLVLIDPHWLVKDSAGSRRIDDPDDWVRHEIEGGLGRAEVTVVPVLIEGAHMPDREQLPDSLKPLASCQAIALGGDDLESDINQLVDSIYRGRLRDFSSGARRPDPVNLDTQS